VDGRLQAVGAPPLHHARMQCYLQGSTAPARPSRCVAVGRRLQRSFGGARRSYCCQSAQGLLMLLAPAVVWVAAAVFATVQAFTRVIDSSACQQQLPTLQGVQRQLRYLHCCWWLGPRRALWGPLLSGGTCCLFWGSARHMGSRRLVRDQCANNGGALALTGCTSVAEHRARDEAS
jgi:hypothetical protein